MAFGKKGWDKKERDNFLDSFIKSKGPKPTKQGKSVVKHDKWDEEDANRLLEEMREFAAAEDRLSDFVATGSNAFIDAFYALVKADPRLTEKKVVRPSYLVNHAVMDEAMKLKEFDEARLYTTGDEIGAAMADVAMEPELEILFDKLQKENDLAQQLEEMIICYGGMQQEIRDAEALMKELEGNDGDPGEAQNYQEQIGTLQEQIEQLAQQMQQIANELDDGLEGKAGQIRSAMKGALNTAIDSAEQMEQLSTAWGLDPGTLRKMPPEQRFELARRLNNDKFRRIAELFGPMHRLAFAEQMRKTVHSNDEVYDLELGNDLARVLPMELLAIKHPILKKDFYRKFYEGQLLSYRLHGTERLAKGAIIACDDSSGSMSGEREVYAKAIGLTLLQLAKAQNRSFHAITFSGPRQFADFNFHDSHKVTVEQVIDYASTSFGGGTCFMTPLSRALDLIREEHEATGRVTADIVFLTDGQCGTTEAWMKEFKAEQERLEFRVYGIAIDCNPESEPLKTICDGRVITPRQLVNGEDLRDIFRSV